ncbi:MAG TPA: hypothetical protein VIQ31_08255 [Phormidium sp.]
MIANKDFSNNSSANSSASNPNYAFTVGDIAMKRAILTYLNEIGIKPCEMSLKSLTYALQRYNGKPNVSVVVYFQKRIGRIGLVYEPLPTRLEVDWEKIASYLPTQEEKNARDFRIGQAKTEHKTYGNAITFSDQPISGWYGNHYSSVNDF